VLLSAPTLKASNASVVDTDTGTKTVNLKISLSAPTTQTVTFNYATADGTAKVADGDFTAIPTTAGSIPAGQTSITVPVTVKADPIATEADESFTLNVTNIVGASNTSAKGTVTIQNDDNSLSIGNVTQAVGTSGTFTFAFPVTLSGPTTTFPVTVKFKTSDGTATVADGDYDAASGTLTIPARSSSGTINVTVNGSGSDPQGSETFYVTLSSSMNATITTAKATGTINNPAPAAWTELGPRPIAHGQVPGNDPVSGRIVGIAPDPTNVNTIYIAAAGGGVWKTTDGGTTWTPLTDGQATTVMGAIAVAPSNPSIIYAGTGESNNSLDSLYGRGILKSTDAGATWTLDGNSVFDRKAISKIVVDPASANTVYAATTDPFNGVGDGMGVWKSTDGGSTWTNTTTSISTTDDITDLVMDPTNDQVLYAAFGYFGGDSANGVYKSTDGGSSWTLLGGLPSYGGRIALTISANGQTLYAAVIDPLAYELLGLYQSTDAGASWTERYLTPNFVGSQGWYDVVLAVDPSNSQRVYAAGAPDYNFNIDNSIIVSSDGGVSWTNITVGTNGHGPHVDHHALAFDAGGGLLDGNDGGIWRATSRGTTWTDLNGNLGITQAQGVGVDPNNRNTVYVGTQDNGTDKYTGTLAWTQVRDGDGGFVHVDPSHPNTVYHEYYGISLERSDDGGVTWASKISGIDTTAPPGPGPESDDPSQFYVPYVLDASNSSHLVLGTNRVYQTTDKGDSWTAISGDLSLGTGTIAALAIAPSSSSTIYAVYSDGTVWLTTNGGSTWSERDGGLPLSPFESDNSSTVDIVVDPSNSQTAYLVRGLFGSGQVWKTTDGGTSWSNISGDLPDQPAHTIVLDTRTATPILYIGTDTGVYRSLNGGTTWTAFGTGMPRTPVYDMEIGLSGGFLTIGTHGRGVWQINLPAPGAAPRLGAPTPLLAATGADAPAPSPRELVAAAPAGGTARPSPAALYRPRATAPAPPVAAVVGSVALVERAPHPVAGARLAAEADLDELAAALILVDSQGGDPNDLSLGAGWQAGAHPKNKAARALRA
jgi:photosystem II stability/assembly factor-like uncharacterized protein